MTWNNYRVTADIRAIFSPFIFNFTHLMHFQGEFLTLRLSFLYLLSSFLPLPVSYSLPAPLLKEKQERRREKGRKTGGQTVRNRWKINKDRGWPGFRKKQKKTPASTHQISLPAFPESLILPVNNLPIGPLSSWINIWRVEHGPANMTASLPVEQWARL